MENEEPVEITRTQQQAKLVTITKPGGAFDVLFSIGYDTPDGLARFLREVLATPKIVDIAKRYGIRIEAFGEVLTDERTP